MADRDRRLGLPEGTTWLADRFLAHARDRLVARSTPGRAAGLGTADEHLLLPHRVENDWPGPTPPIPIRDRFVHADIGPIDRELLATAVEIEEERGAEAVAALAQDFRLPVTPYRAEPPPVRDDGPSTGGVDLAARHSNPVRVAAVSVLDLTAMWAGPLATALLARVGIPVVKIDPDCRPDGFRPRPALYRALNEDKSVVDLDLRRDEDRRRFEQLVAASDLVVDSFSPRVLPNLGYSAAELSAINPRVRMLSIRAFPPGSPERHWTAFGHGVHAASGLAMRFGRPQQTRLAYPDALAGLRGFAFALALLGGEGDGSPVEISLLGTIAPLVERAMNSDQTVIPGVEIAVPDPSSARAAIRVPNRRS